ncbi:hypothetical protein Poli38472_003327 [Pythium oligandrum]|uniref:RNA helicase n=1 Tax=Pythium oligandrum TaxID=41045 RepID=A0A8K1C7E7_PYTOL|nr:hypothetical protein Poli38472_003327 [Pythium oligandrum]|eukprot:TMW57402.1 hypothetical protein Poli38472_003327 [Pythium oligandrum]
MDADRRTMDVSTATATTFAALPLHASVQAALQQMRFVYPSPIQLKALPLSLFGSDVIAQAKSGTGKTAVFGVTAVEHVLNRMDKQKQLQQEQGYMYQAALAVDPMALILAPTREIAMQIHDVLRQLTSKSSDCIIVPVIGGLSINNDQKRLLQGCHIVVGTPGRVRAVIESRLLQTRSIRLLVFDEVDKLMTADFENEIRCIVEAVPPRRQTLAFSATFTPEQLVQTARLMRNPQIVRVRGPNDVTVELVSTDESALATWIEREQQREPELWLRQVRQYYRVVRSVVETDDALHLKSKLVVLARLLTEISFNQCIVFCNDKFRAEALTSALASQQWPTACITGAQTQTTRLQVMQQFRSIAIRILVSTDLTARGIDVDRVNFVVNLDLPRDPATYLHRVAVTLLTAKEVEGIHLLSRVFKMQVDELPTPVPSDIGGYCIRSIESQQVADSTHQPVDEANPSVLASDGAKLDTDLQETSRGASSLSELSVLGHDETPASPSHPPSPPSLAHAQYAWEERSYAHWRALLPH